MHLLLISLDAVEDGDLEILLKLPNFSRLCERGTLVREVDSVFVSNTYPAHTSIITGCHPVRHGIIENCYTQPGRQRPDWRCFAREIRVPTLYQKAAQAGLSVCSVLYPVTEGAASIRWNIPEIPGPVGLPALAGRMLRANPFFTLSGVLGGLPGCRSVSIESLDDLTTHIVCRAQRRHGPDLTLLHLIDVDDAKHRFGPQSEKTRHALLRHDRRLGLVFSAAAKTYRKGDWGAIVFSDHGCLPVKTTVEPNDWLRRGGLIRKEGSRERYDAFFHNAGGSTFLKAIDSNRLEELARLAAEFEKQDCVARRLDSEEMRISGMSTEFAFGFEAAEGFCFGEAHPGQHGYSLRHEGYHAFYAAMGPGIVPREQRNGGCIVDICPLAARMLNLPPWEMDGRDRLLF